MSDFLLPTPKMDIFRERAEATLKTFFYVNAFYHEKQIHDVDFDVIFPIFFRDFHAQSQSKVIMCLLVLGR